MRVPKLFGGRNTQSQGASILLSKYKVGQRAVELLQLADGHVQWVCNCEDYSASAGAVGGAWCKHVAKASAMRSIERLTGARRIAPVAVPQLAVPQPRGFIGPVRAQDAEPGDGAGILPVDSPAPAAALH